MNKRSGHKHKRTERKDKRSGHKRSGHNKTYRKGSKSKTMKGKKDFTTKKSSKVFNRRQHYQKHAKGSRVNRRPYHKKGGAGTTHISHKASKISAAPVNHASTRVESAAVLAKSSHVPTKKTATTSRKPVTTSVAKGSPEWAVNATPQQLRGFLFGARSPSKAEEKSMEKDWDTFMDGSLSPKKRWAAVDKLGLDTKGKQVMLDLYNEDYKILTPIVQRYAERKISEKQALSEIMDANANQLLKDKAQKLIK